MFNYALKHDMPYDWIIDRNKSLCDGTGKLSHTKFVWCEMEVKLNTWAKNNGKRPYFIIVSTIPLSLFEC